MNLLRNLQKKTLVPAQIAGYALTLLVGVAIVILAIQGYEDIKPLLTGQTSVFKAHTVTVSKNITLFKTANKDGIYFDSSELAQIEQQSFVKDVAVFGNSSFNILATIHLGTMGTTMSTDLFFESVPDEYLDVSSEEWVWDSTSGFLPIIIPEDYLNLYNFGFAESQALPVISKGTIEQVSFDIRLRGNGKTGRYTSRIVGFSNKINSILVPEDFLNWANSEFGTVQKQRNSRLLVELSDASDKGIPTFFEKSGYNINKNELEASKLMFFFRFAMLFLFTVALIIIVLSMAFIVMSLNLIVQRNREMFVNLYNIGYSTAQTSRFYQSTISIVTAVCIVVAAIVSTLVRNMYMGRLSSMFDTNGSGNTIWLTAAVTALILIPVYILLVSRSIRRSVTC